MLLCLGKGRPIVHFRWKWNAKVENEKGNLNDVKHKLTGMIFRSRSTTCLWKNFPLEAFQTSLKQRSEESPFLGVAPVELLAFCFFPSPLMALTVLSGLHDFSKVSASVSVDQGSRFLQDVQRWVCKIIGVFVYKMFGLGLYRWILLKIISR